MDPFSITIPLFCLGGEGGGGAPLLLFSDYFLWVPQYEAFNNRK